MRKSYLWVAGIIVIFIIAFSIFSPIYVDWLFFSKLGFYSVWVKIFVVKLLLFFAVFLFVTFVIYLNLVMANRFIVHPHIRVVNDTEAAPPLRGMRKTHIWILTLLPALFFAISSLPYWQDILLFLNATSFHVRDPIFGNDVSFYVFKLPVISWAVNLLLVLDILLIVILGMVYATSGSFVFVRRGVKWWVEIDDKKRKHLAFLFAIMFLLIAVVSWLKGYDLLYSDQGVVFGAGYTDVHANLWGYKIVAVFGVITAISIITYGFYRRLKTLLYGIAMLIVVAIAVLGVYPYIVQKFVVEPSEISRERPYIKDNIRFTRLAYGLDKIVEKKFAFGPKKSVKLSDVMLWDRRPLKQTYKQLQEIRLYYDFNSVDLDRYYLKKLGGVRQVAVSARELNVSQIPAEAQTWVNRHLKYTHGYGVVVSPVDEITEEGLPYFFVSNIPPETSYPELKILRPEIYYGEETNDYVLVNTLTKEFDYPKGDKNVYTSYKGKGGIKLGLLNKLVFMWKYSTLKFILTNYITSNSRIMIHRNIKERVKILAPFLLYDDDPYIIIDNGRLYWMIDAFTYTDKFPYSQPFNESFNYIRNSVKVVVDAYNGDVVFYVLDRKDPIVMSYMKIFPGMFKDISDMPEGLKRHIRYPRSLFWIQANMYRAYHMRDPQVFYNREDYWNIPYELYVSEKQYVEPYYIMLSLPPSKEKEFIVMLPFTPAKKDNMIAWLAASCDFDNYSDMVAYKFPKESLVYGPMQIEARINQTPSISQQLTLWSQKGSSVVRGNLLVIPIEHMLFYVEPLYLIAERGELPELKRVIVSDGNAIVMDYNLNDALSKLLGGNVAYTSKEAGTKRLNIYNLSQQAWDTYRRAEDALKQGNWSLYGKMMDNLRKILKDMAGMKNER